MRLSGESTIPLAGLDDPVAALLHLAGALVFAWQALRLVRRAGDARRRAVALGMFAATGVLVLGISASYHALHSQHAWKVTLQQADHAAIFLLIAATLTCYHAIGFQGRGRWWLAGITWLFALAAILTKTLFWSQIGDGIGLILYVGLSAIGLGALLVLPRRLPWAAFVPMGLGALVYVSGALVDHWSVGWIVSGWLGPHELFHTAVLAALLLHYRFFHTWSLPGLVPPPALPGRPLPAPTARLGA